MKALNQKIDQAAKRLQKVIRKTPLMLNRFYSQLFHSQVFFKREDWQEIRSFKIRGAYNKLASLTAQQKKQGVVCASAGNHAQGVALSCFLLKIAGTIYMPEITSHQKIKRVVSFGGPFIKICLKGPNFDEANQLAQQYAKITHKVFVHAFNDETVIAGQGTIAKEILEQEKGIDFIFVPVGGGGLISGIASYFKEYSPKTKIIGCESDGTASMYYSLKKKRIETLDKVDTFVDGIAIKTPGRLTFKLCQKYVDQMVKIPEGKVAQTMIDLYQQEGIVTEPAGALPVAALFYFQEQIKGKKAVCVISGGNNDLLRYNEVIERSLIFQNTKYYFLINLKNNTQVFKKLISEILIPTVEVIRLEYVKKITNNHSTLLESSFSTPSIIPTIVASIEALYRGGEFKGTKRLSFIN